MVSVHSSSPGHVLSGGQWLDTHFAACRPEYEALLGHVPFEAGANVLDAGCGTGAYLPLLEATVGAAGSVVAADLARANVAVVPGGFARLTADVGRLPFHDAAFDGVWSANVSQYFDDEGLTALLAEFSRVVRPDGLLALKDVDMRAWDVQPAPPFLGAHLAEACAATGRAQSTGSIRGRNLRRFLENAGFVDVEQHSLLIERWAPLDAAASRFWTDWLVYLAAVAEDSELPREDRSFWQSVATPEQATAFVASPSFYGSELQVVAFGRKPGGRHE
ncbi:MAG: class I SAM-dependent methyltransferase [Dehalococcoidia bacterium]